MLLLAPPGVYAPQGDTWLLAEALCREPMPVGARVLDVGTGTGVLAVIAAQRGAERVTAVDVSAWSVLAARLNAWLRRLPIQVHHGDALTAARGEFDLILANPPYVPSAQQPPRRGPARAWDAGPDGREVLNRLCVTVRGMLRPGGVLLMVHSALCGVDATLHRLTTAGLDATVVSRRRQPFGPVLRGRAGWLAARGLVRTGEHTEELVVIRARRQT